MGTEPGAPEEFPAHESNVAPATTPAYRNLLEKRDYDRLAHLLEDRSLAVKSEGSPTAASLIAAARQICRVCLDCQAQKAHIQHLQETAVARERDLRQTLQAMLILLDKAAEGPLEGLSVSELGLATTVPAEADVHPGFWQRIQDLLGLAPATLTPQEIELPAIVATEEAIEPGAGDITPPTTESPSLEESNDRASGKQAEIPSIPEMESDDGASAGEIQPSLVVYCLGPFQAYLNDQPVESWPSGKGKAIFKYLVTHRELPAAKEVLMELFWPEADPDAARNNLNVAIYGLRQALRSASPDLSHVLFQNDAYLLNPELNVWVDVEEFQDRYRLAHRLEQEGDLHAAVREYIAAEALYQLEFLAEDRYDDWVSSRRLQLQTTYLSLLERLSRFHFETDDYPACITVCHKMLAIDSCREDAHQLLMLCYERQGQRYLALRQYHLCVQCLKEELDVSPTPDTIALYDQLRR